MDFVIKSENAGKTIKDFIRYNYNISRRMLILLKNKSDGITVNGVRVTVRFVLSEGDVLSLNYENADEIYQDKSFVIENQSLLDKLNIIYEDDFILAVNKPPDMPSHPSINHFDDTLANLVVAYFRNNNIKSFYRAANRLDKNTSGIVLIAKNKIMSARLNEMMRRGGIEKTYITVLNGNIETLCDSNKLEEINKNLSEIDGCITYNPENKMGCITAPIKREQDSIIKRVCAKDGDYSKTEFKVIKANKNASVLEVFPKTGRTHQIRLHFYTVGFPLMGEDLYGENNTHPDYHINRHALHAYRLEFDHPENNEKMNVVCELSEDIKGIINKV